MTHLEASDGYSYCGGRRSHQGMTTDKGAVTCGKCLRELFDVSAEALNSSREQAMSTSRQDVRQGRIWLGLAALSLLVAFITERVSTGRAMSCLVIAVVYFKAAEIKDRLP